MPCTERSWKIRSEPWSRGALGMLTHSFSPSRALPHRRSEQQLDHLQILRLGRIEQAALHGPARVAVEELGEFVGPVAVGVDMGAFDLVQDVLARQHLLRHLAVGNVDEGVELRCEVDVLPVQGGEDDAARSKIQSFDGLLRRGCGGHWASLLIEDG